MSDFGGERYLAGKVYANILGHFCSQVFQNRKRSTTSLREHLSAERMERKRSIREWHKLIGPWGHSKEWGSHWKMEHHWKCQGQGSEEMVYLPRGFLWWQLSSIECVGHGNREDREVTATVRLQVTTAGTSEVKTQVFGHIQNLQQPGKWIWTVERA